MEDYRTMYEEALERAKDYHKGHTVDVNPQAAMEYVFPILKENKDEDIRKALIKSFEIHDLRALIIPGFSAKDVIDWLEKQGEKVDAIENFNTEFERQVSHLIASTINKEYEYTSNFVKWTANALLNYAKHELEKQVGQKQNVTDIISDLENYFATTTKEQQEKDWDEIKNWEEKHFNHDRYIDKKPTDKVEPKFKVGDWIISSKGMIRHIVAVGKTGYQTDNGWLTHDNYEKSFHLWTIQDAKDGDILLSPSTSEGDKECPFIFKEIDKDGIVRFYAALLQSECLKITDGITNVIGYANSGYHIPATKEQRDLLFQKMKESGYEWDAEKKEVKKIEQKPEINDDVLSRFAFYQYDDDTIYLSSLFVRESNRRCGYGSKALKAAEEVAKTFGVSKIRLKVERNTWMEEWYKKNGYEYLSSEGKYDWLEKQPEQKPNFCHHEVDLSDCSEEYRRAYYDGWNNCNQQHAQLKAEQKPAWSEEDNIEISVLINALGELETYGGDFSKEKIWLKSIKERVQPQTKQEWSEEDEEMFDAIIADIQFTQKAHTHEVNQVVYEMEIDWLKSLKDRVQPQPKQEWSEEDEKMLNDIIVGLTSMEQLIFTHDVQGKTQIQGRIDWLKSLKERHTWKPSDEQIDVLVKIINSNTLDAYALGILQHLYQDLKKLMEE